MCTTKTIHPFETAGLGKAPFKFAGMYEDRGPKQYPNGMTVGAPGQPMGTCEYCGQGIALCCRIASADGKTFVVGSDCVEKTNDPKFAETPAERLAAAALLRGVNKELNAHKAAQRRRLKLKKLAAIQDWFNDNQARLSSMPNPVRPGETLWDCVCWYRRNAGARGLADLQKRLLTALQT